ncbi:MAG TPA: LPS export ABC transporter ATP-binding protein [Gemmatimonadaceae bacterium]|nr:LPS export ABC transporter ATP-binding protein [Gemmatimonadaceae bacterium]
MSQDSFSPRIREIIKKLSGDERSMSIALAAIVREADDAGSAPFHSVAIRYRDEWLRNLRAEGKDAEREAGRLGVDEVEGYLATSILPRMVGDGIIHQIDPDADLSDTKIQLTEQVWQDISPNKGEIAELIRHTGEHSLSDLTEAPRIVAGGSILEAAHLMKSYRRRAVVNDVGLRLQQGEIVGLLGPNGAGKTTTFYMIVGLIEPQQGRIILDGKDITNMPMYKRARLGIGYLSQEPSIFRKLSVEDNIMAILETLDISKAERHKRLEKLLDELSIKRLRKNKAYSLSGGERRRLEITRALVTDPKFMMLDEPFAGVDPIAVHDIQTIVAGLRHRGIGVLISDHNVEQTLDIVDRAYIMFDGQVKVSGTVRDLVFDDTVADIYLGPTLTARLRQRFSHVQEAGAGS